MSPDLPYVLRKGDDEQTSMYNRIAALERIKHLTGVDLREKSTEYKQLIDCELYVKYYKDLPLDIAIDEDFCQRSAEVIRQLEKEKKEDLEKTLEGIPERVDQLYKASRKAIPMTTATAPLNLDKNRNAFLSIIRKFLPKKV